MAVLIAGIIGNSPVSYKPVYAGDMLHNINGHEISDVLDYQFYASEERLRLTVSGPSGWRILHIYKAAQEDLGLEFDTYLMDKQRRCANNCAFCFIDQLPEGLRDSLYFKDDDTRLSFLFGNYITLTNLKERDIERIIEMHISPVNISVHTMNPELRVKMMGNKNAGKALAAIARFAQAGIKMNTQLVLCPHINDGDELLYSMRELAQFYPAVQSIAAVPVGLTKYREGLAQLEPYEADTAAAVLDLIEAFGDSFLQQHGTRLVFPADEFYLKAGRPVPDAAFYEEFAQLENGVGLWASLRTEFFKALEDTDCVIASRAITMATGAAAFPLIQELAQAACKKHPALSVQVIAVKNQFFGERINVAGLLTATDLINQLSSEELGEELLIPAVMLRREGDLFLDDLSVQNLSERLNISVSPVQNDGIALAAAMLGV